MVKKRRNQIISSIVDGEINGSPWMVKKRRNQIISSVVDGEINEVKRS